MSWVDPLQDNPRFQSVRTLKKSVRGTVILALDRTTGDHVAIRFISRGWDARQHKYLLRELLIHQELSAYQHPHIVVLKEVFLTPTHLAVVTEYVGGTNLQEFLTVEEGGRLPEALSRFLFQQLILVLDFCHQRKKVCRSVKLASTLLQLSPGQLPLLKLADFGYSKDIEQHSPPRSQVGTALFVPPEVMYNFNNSPYDGVAFDVWAAGVVLFFLLFGRHPFLRPEDTTRSEKDQMLALFTRTAASQFCLLPEEALSISPGCAELLGHMLQTKPEKRYTMSEIQAHPWFKQLLPEGAATMNSTIIAAASARPLQFKQPPKVIAELVQRGQLVGPNILAQQITPQPAAAVPPTSRASAAATVAVTTSATPSQVPLASSAPMLVAGGTVVTTPSPSGRLNAAGSSAAAAVAGQQQQQQQQRPGHMWGAPPLARALAHSTSSSDHEQGQLYHTLEQQQQQQQQQQQSPPPGAQPPVALTPHESTSSTINTFIALRQQQQQQPFQPQQQPLQQQWQQISPRMQQQLWQPQQHATASANTSGMTAGAAAAARSSGLSASVAAAGAVEYSTAAGDLAAVSSQPPPAVNHMAALQLQPQQQQSTDATNPLPDAYVTDQLEGLRSMDSADLEALISLDSVPDLNAAASQAAALQAAAGSSDMQGRLAGANARLPLDVFASIPNLQHLPSGLSEFRLESLMGIIDNALLSEQQQQEHGVLGAEAAVAAAHQPGGAVGGSSVAEGQAHAGQHMLSGDSGTAADQATAAAAGAAAATEGLNTQDSVRSGTRSAAAADTPDDQAGNIEIPEDFAAFLVDEEDIAIARGGDGEAARMRRKRVLSNAGAGASSLNLRQLSGMLLDGTASLQQLLEGSLFHKSCSEWGFRDRSLLDFTGGRGDGDDQDILQSLQGLRDMSITREGLAQQDPSER